MKSILMVLAISTLSFVTSATAETPDETAMNGALKGLAAAFNKPDAKAAAEFFAADASVISPGGVHAKGREKIAEVIQRDLSTMLKGGKNDIKLETMRSLGPDVAFVDAIHEISGFKPPAQMPNIQLPPMKVRITGVAKKTGGKWLWLEARAYMAPMGPPPGGMMPPPGGMQHGMPPGMKGQVPHPPNGTPGGAPPNMQAPPPPPPGSAPKK